jgi:hypothetical protein
MAKGVNSFCVTSSFVLPLKEKPVPVPAPLLLLLELLPFYGKGEKK